MLAGRHTVLLFVLKPATIGVDEQRPVLTVGIDDVSEVVSALIKIDSVQVTALKCSTLLYKGSATAVGYSFHASYLHMFRLI